MDQGDEEMYEQFKALAEYVHLKLLLTYLAQQQLEDLVLQFKLQLSNFNKLYSEFPHRHYAFLSDQFVSFAQLIVKSGLNSQIPKVLDALAAKGGAGGVA
ncbi:hypothetical protein EON65_23490, partial [archaeon]